ncbi:MAG: endonuclease/exonuclease/phosphatase family protein, partial [Actinomycetota bacterium]
MRLKAILATALIVAQLAVMAPATRAAFPAESQTPPGQVSVLTVNARQGLILDRKRFEQLFELVRALRGRPEAFDGGNRGAALVPDVIAFQEIRPSNLEILKRLMNQRFRGGGFEIAGRTDADVKFIINTQTVALAGQERTWQDHCLNHKFPGGEPRVFQLLPLVELSSGAPFTVAGVYWSATYASDTHDCRLRNAKEIKMQLPTDLGPAFVVGDFNTRAVETLHECDPDERSAPREWWIAMTQPAAEGRAFTDAVKSHSKGMASEWTHEQKTPRDLCNGSKQAKRSRIDYIFSDGAVVAEAHADEPGWAGETPGTRHFSPGWYSDHRIVWARFVIAGPPRPETPSATPGKGGVIQLQWAPVEGAAGWILYRATGANPYRPLTRLDSTATTFVDHRTSHGRRYRYAIAALGAEGSQGLESRGRFGRADAR